MTDHHLDRRVALLRRVADGVPVGPLHTDLLLATAHRRRRQRRAAALAAATVLVVAGGTAAVGLTGDAPSRHGDDALVTQPAPTPETRLVGVGRLAVEVPADWPSGKAACSGFSVPEPTVFNADFGGGGRGCLITEPAPYVATVTGHRTDGVEVSVGVEELTSVDVPGGEVLASAEPTTAGGLVTMVLSHDPSGLLQVATRSEAETRAIVESARIVPPGHVAVPWTPEAIEAAGLVVEEVPVDTDARFTDGYVLGTQPGGGSVVPAGSTVRVRVARNTAWPPGEPGPAISCVYTYPEDLPERAQAVAGTVTEVRLGRYDGDAGATAATVTLAVDEWFRGGSGPTVVLHTVDLMLPDRPQDAVGVRILAAFGPTRDMMACGFTRSWDEKTARAWRDAVG
ncbi:PASTA domain-containing protein [Nocardioides sp. cx-173]|uniref:PASTA domain-containing protein n=1 Tax=Nocardioides sp. cx-173 TaxID=2898796 RepID=UPI001E477B62|nr:PASTA domain-containing protein [Nocardioides sp. cx-173]MCD4526233.1 PASTA domain-containing protein [Nocardioides sp. cx-173]UGB40557.1 PASTA domain-containing protein [Nocardioides sp. cx-173]